MRVYLKGERMQPVNINEIIKHIDEKLIDFYGRELEKDTGMTICDYIASLNLGFADFIEDLKESRKKAKKNRIKTKLNWYACAIRDLGQKKRSSSPFKYYNLLLSQGENLSWDEFVLKYTDFINRWKDGDLMLTEFPFLSVCTLKTKKSAFEKELVIRIIDVIEKAMKNNKEVENVLCDNSFSKGVSLQPLEFIIGPIVSVYSPGSLMLDIYVDSQNRTFLYNDYHVPCSREYGDIMIRSLIPINEITQQETNLRTLSAFDVSLFLYIVNYVYEKDYATFLKTRTFQNYLVDIVKAMYPNEKKLSARLYANVKNSLVKLASLNIKGYRNNQVVSVINFFDSFNLFTDDNGKQVVSLSIGSYMFERISTKKIQHIYSDEVKLIEDRSAQFVYYIFENERQMAYAENRIDVPQEYSYSFLLHKMRFPVRSSVRANMDLIDKIFRLFIDLGILFEWYERKIKCFVVKFKPFTKDDIISLNLNNPTPLLS